MKKYLSILFILLCSVSYAQPKKTPTKKTAYDSTYIFNSKRPQVLVGQQVMVLEANVNNGLPVSQILFTKGDEGLTAVPYRKSVLLIGAIYTITGMESVTWCNSKRTLYTMIDTVGTKLWYMLNVNGEISQFTPIIPMGFIEKEKKTYAGKKVKIGWDSSFDNKKIRNVENSVYEFVDIIIKRTNDYAGEHMEPYYVLRIEGGNIRHVPLHQRRFLETQPDSTKLGLTPS